MESDVRILIIEDNATNMALVTYLLHAFGYATLEARNGREALDGARNGQPDLIICDLQLPDVDGYEVARQIRQDPVLRKIPMVAVTASAMVGDRERVLSAGFDGYIAKPVVPETFVSELEVYLGPQKALTARRPTTGN